MKKLAFGLTMMVSGALFATGAMIGGGLVVGGVNAGTGVMFTLSDFEFATVWIMIGTILFLVGLVIAARAAFGNDSKTDD